MGFCKGKKEDISGREKFVQRPRRTKCGIFRVILLDWEFTKGNEVETARE